MAGPHLAPDPPHDELGADVCDEAHHEQHGDWQGQIILSKAALTQ